MESSTLDIVYLFRHSKHGDQEILYSLRSVAHHLSFIRKVWVFGDKPEFMSGDKSLIEHLGHGYIAPLLGYRLPVRNDFLLLFLASLIPELAFSFVRFADDYIILQPLTHEQLCTPRAVDDLNKQTVRGCGGWKDQLWRTFDALKQYGYAGYNFESHVPQPYTRRIAFESFMAFRQFLSEERYEGLVTGTTIYNYALKHYQLPFIWLAEEQSRAGFYGHCPSEIEIEASCREKLFLNFDSGGFGAPMQQFLEKTFPDPCKYEKA